MAKKIIKKKKTRKAKKDLECVFGILCSSAILDQRSNNLSLFNVIDQINIKKEIFEKIENTQKFINIALEHEIATVWRTCVNQELCHFPMNILLKVKLLDPNGKILNEHLVNMILPSKTRRHRFAIHLNGMPLTSPGDYVYVIEAAQNENKDRFEHECSIPFEVSLRGNQ